MRLLEARMASMVQRDQLDADLRRENKALRAEIEGLKSANAT